MSVHGIVLAQVACDCSEIVISLIVVVAIHVNQHYYNSIRDNLISANYLIAFAISGFAYDEAFYCDWVPFSLFERTV